MKLLHSVALFLLVLAAAGLASGCRERSRPAAEVLLQVDGRSVTLEAFRRQLKQTLPSAEGGSEEDRQALERSLLAQLIDRELVLGEADRLGITVAVPEVEKALAAYRRDYPPGGFASLLRERGTTLEQWRKELRQRLRMEKAAQQAVYDQVTVTGEEISAYYREHPEEFDRPAQVRARQIMVGSEEEGQRVLGLLRQGKPFAEVAAAHSLSPDAEQGGDLGFFARGEMPPEFDAVVFTLAPGRLSELVKSEYGYHVFLVEERRKAMRLPLDKVRDDIRARLLAGKKEQAYRRWLQDLRRRAAIEVNWSLLKSS